MSSAAVQSQHAPKLARRALVLIILGACVLAAGCWRVYSNTWDEPEHLAAGVELLDRGKYEYDTEHPPLGRVFLAIGPYLAGARSFGTPPPEGTPEGLHILYSKGAYWRDLTLARLGMLPFLVLLLYATWLWARRLLPSEGAALLAVLLTVSVPPLLGHAALASLDVAAAATTLLALYALQRWMVSAGLGDAAFFGLASGVAVVTKFSAVPFIGVALIVLSLIQWAVARRERAAGGLPAEAPLPARDAALPASGSAAAAVAAPRSAAAPLPAPPAPELSVPMLATALASAVDPASMADPAPLAAAAGVATVALAQTEAPPPRQLVDPLLWRARVAGLALAALVGLAPVWLAYGPRVADPAGVALRFNWAVSYLLQQHGLAHAFGVLLSHLWLPRELEDLANGIVAVEAHNNTGHLSYLLGETRLTGWWYFYLVALAVKTPIPLLVAGPIGMVALAVHGWRRRDSWALAPLAVVVAVLVFASAVSRINIGIRHILIVYPFFALGAAWLTVRAWRALRSPSPLPRAVAVPGGVATHVPPMVNQTANHRLKHLTNLRTLGAAALFALLAWQLSPLWRAWPDYLPYFNEAVAHPERVLVDSDLDWGQDLHRLEVRARQLHIGYLNLAYRGTADLRREPLPPLQILQPRERATGWVAVSQLARTRNLTDYDWLDAYRPLERVGKTIDLYYLP